MNATLQVALLCFKEGLRHRILYGIFVCATLLMLFSLLISGLFMRDILKIILDICLAATTLGGLLVPFFLAVNVLAGDIDEKTFATILARPVDRASYILGKFFGLALLTLTIMGVLTLATLLAVGGASLIYAPHFLESLSIPAILAAIGYKGLGIVLLNSLVLLWSTVTTSTFLATLLTLFTYLIGQTVEDVVRFLSLEHQGVALSPVVSAVAKLSLYVFPNLAAFNFDRQAAYGLAIPPMEALAALAYGAAYSAVILGLTVFFFRRRDLP